MSIYILYLMLGLAGAGPQDAEEGASVDAALPPPREAPKADDDAMELMEVDIPVVVTAGRREQSAALVPQAISVVTQEDIRRSGARSVADALRLVPGVDVADLAAGAAAISPRGFHGFVNREVLVLIDGRQVFDSLFGGTLWFNWPFQMEDIERIEVIRGPAGVTWGANALCGVINIITRDPADQLGTTLTLGGGSRGANREHLGHAWRDGRLRLSVSGEHEAHDGFTEGGSILRPFEDDYRAGRLRLRAIYDFNENETLAISAGHALVDGAFSPPPLAGLGLRRNSGSQASFAIGHWSRRLAADERLDLTFFVNDFQVSPGLPTIDYRYQQFGLQLGRTLKPADGHTLTWGFDSRADLLDAGNSDPQLLSREFVSTGIVGAYVQDEWRFAPRWALNLGARVDYEFYGGWAPSGRAALSYDISERSMVYAAASRAFQMPSAGLRFIDFPMLNGLAWVKGDRDLDVETINAIELGYRTRWSDRLDTSLTPFWHDVRDVTTLEKQFAPPSLLRLDLDNRADATTASSGKRATASRRTSRSWAITRTRSSTGDPRIPRCIRRTS